MDNEIKEYIIAKRKPISHCIDLTKYFIGRHKIVPVYLTPTFEMEFNSSMQKLKELQEQVKKQKEVIDKANKLINHYLKNIDESGSYVETNTRWKLIPEILKELEDILKEVSE